MNVKSIQDSITHCTSWVGNEYVDWCPISLGIEANRFPLTAESVLECNTTTTEPCTYTVRDPWQDSWYYLRINKTDSRVIEVDFSVEISVTGK